MSEVPRQHGHSSNGSVCRLSGLRASSQCPSEAALRQRGGECLSWACVRVRRTEEPLMALMGGVSYERGTPVAGGVPASCVLVGGSAPPGGGVLTVCSVVSEIAIGVHRSLNVEGDVLFQSHTGVPRS